MSEVDDCPEQNEPLEVDSDEKSPTGNQKHHDEPQSDEEVLSSGAEEGDEVRGVGVILKEGFTVCDYDIVC